MIMAKARVRKLLKLFRAQQKELREMAEAQESPGRHLYLKGKSETWGEAAAALEALLRR